MIQVLLSANHKTNQWEWKGKLFKCKPGQFITSLKTLKKKCASNVTIQNIRTALIKLKTWQFLTNESTKTGRLITVLNWDAYQDIHKEDQQSNQQTTNKQLTTNKNDKELENKYSPNSDEIRMSKLLLDLILLRNPNHRKPDLQKWCVHVHRMLSVDKRERGEIEKVIRWFQSDESKESRFWNNNVMCTEKLRKQFDQLKLKMDYENPKRFDD
jgi:hypothetical protein